MKPRSITAPFHNSGSLNFLNIDKKLFAIDSETDHVNENGKNIFLRTEILGKIRLEFRHIFPQYFVNNLFY